MLGRREQIFLVYLRQEMWQIMFIGKQSVQLVQDAWQQ